MRRTAHPTPRSSATSTTSIATHVALSFQFFNKSKRNIAENPQALVRLIDPDTSQGWRLKLRFVRSETEGPVFDRMALRIEAIASYSGLKGIFKLLAADIYEVLSVEAVADEAALEVTTQRRSACVDPVFTMQALQDLSTRIHRADSLERLLDSILEGLETSFGFEHSMILVSTIEEGTYVTIASRGYPEMGVGAEARLGEGIIGMVAEARKPIRISGLIRQMLYALAVQKRAHEQGIVASQRIPLPGLAQPDSQLGMPLLVRGELVGVLCIESTHPYRFHEEDKTTIELLGSYLAIAIQNMQLQERSTAEAAADADSQPAAPKPRPALAKAGRSLATPGQPAASSREASGEGGARAGVLRGRRVHPGGRGVSDPQPAREDPVAAAAAPHRRRACRVHQPRAEARQVAQPARVERQP